jgi:hypothetical protein
MLRLIRGVNPDYVVNEIKVATEKCYPIKEGKTIINTRTIYTYIREHANEFPNISIAKNDRFMKRIIRIVYSDFGWEIQANKKSKSPAIRGTIFIRSFKE